jgi:FkbM family methyltransferase
MTRGGRRRGRETSLEARAADFLISPRVRADAAGSLPPMCSYAQNFEDVILRRALQDVSQGFYVDVGAWDPVRDSVTAWFYETGWRGINVEPFPDYFTPLAATRPEDINLPVVVGASSGEREFFLLAETGLSSGAAGARQALREFDLGKPKAITAPAMTLDEVFALAKGRTIDFLKVDVEGMEPEVLGSADFVGVRPRIVVVEATAPNTQLPTYAAWEPLLTAKGYAFVLFDGLNRFYLRAEDAWRAPIFATPPNVFDNFAKATLDWRQRDLREALAKVEDEARRLRRKLSRRRRRGL